MSMLLTSFRFNEYLYNEILITVVQMKWKPLKNQSVFRGILHHISDCCESDSRNPGPLKLMKSGAFKTHAMALEFLCIALLCHSLRPQTNSLITTFVFTGIASAAGQTQCSVAWYADFCRYVRLAPECGLPQNPSCPSGRSCCPDICSSPQCVSEVNAK